MTASGGPWWRSSIQDAAPFLGLGMQLAVAVLLFFLVGWWVDSRYDTGPYGMLVGSAVGITGGMIKFIRTVTGPGFRRPEKGRDEAH